jgi:pyruvate dehydrogenase phosphatase
MFRVTTRALRSSGLALKRVPFSARFSSTQTSTSDNAKYLWSAAAVLSVGSGAYLFSGKSTSTAKASNNAVPSLSEYPTEEQIPVNSPVKSIILEDANAKLREDAHTFVFEGHAGAKGRVDFARLGSNNPIEDDWDLKIAKGVGGTTTLYAGVYDGHA